MIAFFLKTKHFVPDQHVENVCKIDFDKLYESGIRVLLVDLDNTLIPYDVDLPNDEIKALFLRLKAIGFSSVIISNNRKSRVEPCSNVLGIDYVSSAKKPLKSGFKKALKKLQETPSPNQVFVIGDQLMTDVFGAKRLGYSVGLVEPIKVRSEKWYTKFNRSLERQMLKKIYRKNPEAYQDLKLKKR